MKARHFLWTTVVVLMCMGSSFAMPISEDFESYTPDTSNSWPLGSANWTPEDGWVPSFNQYGWASYQADPWYIWPDGGYVAGSPQVLRHNQSSGRMAFWELGADKVAYPTQILSAKQRGLYQYDYHRFGLNYAGASLEVENYTDNPVFMGEVMPENAAPYNFGPGYAQDWFEFQIEYDFEGNLARARYGRVLGEVWNNWTGWHAIDTSASTDFAKITMDNLQELDDFVLTAVPEPATMVLLGLGGLAMIRRRN